MNSIIIASKNKKEREDYALTLCKKQDIKHFDITIVSFEEEEGSRSTIGIKQVREMQKNVLLKPLHGNKKAIIIHDAHLLTVEAQNALLKLLEEPPLHTTIILTLSQKDILLSTICSRCHIIDLPQISSSVPPADTIQTQEFIQLLLSSSVGQRLKHAQDIAKNKDEAIVWLEKGIFALREQLLGEIMEKDVVDKRYIEILRQLQWGYLVASTTNTNPRLLLENIFLSL